MSVFDYDPDTGEQRSTPLPGTRAYSEYYAALQDAASGEQHTSPAVVPVPAVEIPPHIAVMSTTHLAERALALLQLSAHAYGNADLSDAAAEMQFHLENLKTRDAALPVAAFIWNFDEEPPLESIASQAKRIAGDSVHSYFTTTCGSALGLVISPRELTQQDAQLLFDRWLESDTLTPEVTP